MSTLVSIVKCSLEWVQRAHFKKREKREKENESKLNACVSKNTCKKCKWEREREKWVCVCVREWFKWFSLQNSVWSSLREPSMERRKERKDEK